MVNVLFPLGRGAFSLRGATCHSVIGEERQSQDSSPAQSVWFQSGWKSSPSSCRRKPRNDWGGGRGDPDLQASGKKTCTSNISAPCLPSTQQFYFSVFTPTLSVLMCLQAGCAGHDLALSEFLTWLSDSAGSWRNTPSSPGTVVLCRSPLFTVTPHPPHTPPAWMQVLGVDNSVRR